MTAAPILRTHFGDAVHAFALPFEEVQELERVTGTGIGGLYKRLTLGEFRLLEISETIRLALIGGGTSPKDAADLCQLYARNRPLEETFPLALSILENRYFGNIAEADETDNENRAGLSSSLARAPGSAPASDFGRAETGEAAPEQPPIKIKKAATA